MDRQNPLAVWSNGYNDVWHLDEDPSGSAPQIRDSSGAGRNGSSGGGMPPTAQVPGRIGGSLDFDGSDDYIDLGSGCPVGNNWTVEFWVYPNTPSPYDRLYMQGSSACTPHQLTVYWGPAGHLEVYTSTTGSAGNPQAASAALMDDRLYHFAWTFDGSLHTIYIDGTTSLSAGSGSGMSVDGILYMGRRNSPGNNWRGRLDESRLSTSARSADWIQTQVQSMQNTLVNFGVEEPAM